MKKAIDIQTFDPYNDIVLTLSDLQAIRVKGAKRANQRMLRLERSTSPVTGESFASFGAIVNAKHYLKKQGRNRFSEVKKPNNMTKEQIINEIIEIQAFLNAKTSTVSGMKTIEKTRMNAFKSGKWKGKTSLKFASNKSFYNFLNSKTFQKLVSSGFSSEQIVDMFDRTRDKTGTFKETNKRMDDLVKAVTEYESKGKPMSIKEASVVLGIKPIIIPPTEGE